MGNVKQLSYKLSTGVGTLMTTTTSKIDGYLEGAILISDKPINITISLDDYPQIILFEETNYIGTHYFPIRTPAFGDSMTDVFEEQAEKWALRDKLRIRIDGNMETEVTIILRYS